MGIHLRHRCPPLFAGRTRMVSAKNRDMIKSILRGVTDLGLSRVWTPRGTGSGIRTRLPTPVADSHSQRLQPGPFLSGSCTSSWASPAMDSPSMTKTVGRGRRRSHRVPVDRQRSPEGFPTPMNGPSSGLRSGDRDGKLGSPSPSASTRGITAATDTSIVIPRRTMGFPKENRSPLIRWKEKHCRQWNPDGDQSQWRILFQLLQSSGTGRTLQEDKDPRPQPFISGVDPPTSFWKPKGMISLRVYRRLGFWPGVPKLGTV